MPATSNCDSNTQQPILYVAFELSWTEWKLAFGTGLGASPRLRSVPARKLDRLLEEIAKAKSRLGLPENAAVRSCYEAGRDGFWLHRFLTSREVAIPTAGERGRIFPLPPPLKEGRERKNAG